MKIMVVFYSRSGHTKRVALDLARELKAETDEIIDLKNRKGIIGWLGSGRDAMKMSVTDIEVSKDPGKYDLVVMGSPVWAWNLTPAIRAYIAKFKSVLPKIAFFITSDNTPPARPVAFIENISGRKVTCSAGWNTAELKDPEIYKEKLTMFIQEIQQVK